jgi:tetratricopeptide (TPR) repeat protein
MGHLHELQGRPAEAEGSYREAIRLESGYVEAHTNLGHLLASQGRLTAAEVSCREALRLDPANALAHNNLGLVMLKLDRYAEAEACFRHAIRIDPYLHRAHNNLGNTLLNGPQRREEALACYDRALELAPGSAEVWTNRGLALSQAQRHWEALASHDRAIELEPDYAQAWNNRGKTLNDLKRYDESLCNHDRSIALKPGYAEAWLNRGNTLKDLRRYEEAVTSYEQAIKEEPNYAEAHYNKGLLQLEKRDFSAGFKNYLQRWRTKSFSSPPIRTHLSPWRPGLPSEKILLWGEQGLGDEIFYARMLRRALGQGSDFTLAADQRLHQIFKRSFPNIKLVDRGEVDNGVVDADFDAQAPMGDLGYLLQFDPTKTESVRQPFLLPDPEKSAEFKADQGFGSGKLVCGISWRSANKESGTDKSIRLTDLEPVLSNPNLTLVNLQYGDVDAEIEKFSALGNRHIRQFKGLDIYKDIDSLLSLIDACDLIVTTSNVTAHLAGAIGKKGCVIVPHAKGRIWYWHLDDIVSTWYPSLRVFYQEDPYNWSGAIRQAAQWVEDCCRST